MMANALQRFQAAVRRPVAVALLLCALTVGPASCALPPPARPASLSGLHTYSVSRKGDALLKADTEVTLLDHAGSGCLTYMWFAMDERTRIRVYVDGEATPSIDMACDLGHGYAFGPPPAPFASPVMGRYGAQFNTYQIPYRRHIRVTLFPMTPTFDGVTGNKVWYTLRGTDGLPCRVAGMTLPPSARLRLYRREAYAAKPLEEFSLCDVKGPGMLYLVVIAAQGLRDSGNQINDLSYMEGCVRAYFDGDARPEFLSSGLEDYFLGSGYFFQNTPYYGTAAGLTYINKGQRAFSAYRFHTDDPVFFQQGLRLTLRDGDTYDGTANGPVVLDPPPARYTTYAWLYQW